MAPQEARREPDEAERETTAQEVVHDDGDPGGGRHLAETLHGLLRLEVMEREPARDDVGGPLAAGQRGGVSADRQDLGVRGGDLARERQRRPVALDDDDADRAAVPASPLDEADREGGRAAADVHDAERAVRWD